jgi:hypothetical protein
MNNRPVGNLVIALLSRIGLVLQHKLKEDEIPIERLTDTSNNSVSLYDLAVCKISLPRITGISHAVDTA